MVSSVSAVAATESTPSSAYAGNPAALKKVASEAATTTAKPLSSVVTISVKGAQQMRAGATPAPAASTQTSTAATGVDLKYASADSNRDGTVTNQEQVAYDSRHTEKAMQTYTAVQQLGAQTV